MICPFCGAENIEGADECDGCNESLTDLSLPVPATAIEADLLRDRIAKLWPRTPVSVSPETPVDEVLHKMINDRIGCVTIVESERCVGIFSERDALMRLNIDAEKYRDRPVSQFMTPNPETLEAKDKIAFALHKMNVGGYRHIPILDNGELVGIISIRDILRYLTERIGAAGIR
jgi:signal-transduction protein with cAMP-binding, CBS, and nucleotidyltransferase domain